MKVYNENFSFRFWLVLIVLIFVFTNVQGQADEELKKINQVRIDYNKKGMLILGSWAVGNMVLGGIMAGRTRGDVKAFHQMNLYWNTVNLAIAAFGYYSAINEVSSRELWESISAQHSIEKILLVNAALDVAYMAGGLYIWERGRRIEKDQLIGFGKSIILQGAFLMSFDLIKYLFHYRNGEKLPEILNHVGITDHGIGLVMTF